MQNKLEKAEQNLEKRLKDKSAIVAASEATEESS